MDWQEISALAIVALTIVAFLWSNFRPRKLTFQQVSHCGCSQTSPKSSIIIQGRRGEAPQITMRMK